MKVAEVVLCYIKSAVGRSQQNGKVHVSTAALEDSRLVGYFISIPYNGTDYTSIFDRRPIRTLTLNKGMVRSTRMGCEELTRMSLPIRVPVNILVNPVI